MACISHDGLDATVKEQRRHMTDMHTKTGPLSHLFNTFLIDNTHNRHLFFCYGGGINCHCKMETFS